MLLTFSSSGKGGSKESSATPSTPYTDVSSSQMDGSTPAGYPVFKPFGSEPQSGRREKKRSKGCITCNVRKKGCDMARPICGSCARLNRVCKYREEGMTEDDVRKIKEYLRMLEEDAKRSKRKKMKESSPESDSSKRPKTNEPESPKAKKKQSQVDTLAQESRVVFNPMSPSFINLFTREDTPSAFSLSDTAMAAYQPAPQEAKSPSQDYTSLEESMTSDFHLFREMNPDFSRAFQNSLMYEPQEGQSSYHDQIVELIDGQEQEATVEQQQDSERVVEVAPAKNYKPTLYTAPSMVKSTTLSTLGPIGRRLFDYYRDHLAVQISTVPKEENMFLTSYLPMAHLDFGLLYGILSWSAFRIGGESMDRRGIYFMKKSLEYMKSNPVLLDDVKDPNYLADVEPEVSVDISKDEERELTNESEQEKVLELVKNAEALDLGDRVDMRFATYNTMIGVFVCRGDVKHWFKYLEYGARLIRHSGGVYNYGHQSKERHFLMSSYAYHDMQSSSVNERELHFSIDDYDSIWDYFDFGIDALHGLSKPIYGLIAKINELSMRARVMLKQVVKSFEENAESPVSKDDSSSVSSSEFYAKQISDADQVIFQTRYEVLEWVNDRARELEQALEKVKPNLYNNSILGLSSKDLELQLTLFEIFQLTAKIHLKQSVYKMNQSCLEIQYLTTQLVGCLDVVLGTPVECCLCFPLFIAGMNCITAKDRNLMKTRFENLKRRYSWKNVDRAEIIMLKFWELNPTGEKFVDWYGIVKDLGWDLSFA